MRIAIVAEVFLPKIDGVVRRTLNLIEQLVCHGDQVIVICPEGRASHESPVPLIEFPSFPCRSYPEYRIGRPDQRLIQELKSFQPDVIHFLNPFAFGFQCRDLLCRSGLNVPIVFSFHTLYGDFVKRYRGVSVLSNALWWLTKCYHNTADRNLTVSSVMTDGLRLRGFRNVALWPPAVDGELFSPTLKCGAMRRRLCGNHPESPLLLTVSRLASEKNVGFLKQVLDRIPDATLAIVGGGPQREELERIFSGCRTHFVGYLHGAELASAYASADVFVYASETETMGNVILEAMASGLPVVAANAGGVPSLLQHGVDGFLFAPGDADEAASFVKEVLFTPDCHTRVSVAARESAKGCTWMHAADVVRSHYRSTIADFNESSSLHSGRSRPGMLASFFTRMLVRMFGVMARKEYL